MDIASVCKYRSLKRKSDLSPGISQKGLDKKQKKQDV
jgi:hypothetical protein